VFDLACLHALPLLFVLLADSCLTEQGACAAKPVLCQARLPASAALEAELPWLAAASASPLTHQLWLAG